MEFQIHFEGHGGTSDLWRVLRVMTYSLIAEVDL